MSIPLHYVFYQGRVIRTLALAACHSLHPSNGSVDALLEQTVRVTVPPPPPALVADFAQHVGSDPSRYAQELPPTLFGQWGLPMTSHIIESLPYNFLKVINAGCTLEVKAPLQARRPLHLSARLVAVSEEEGRVSLVQRLETGTEDVPSAVVASVSTVIPSKTRKSSSGARPGIPLEARCVDTWHLSPRAAFEFALLTGDFAPMHWIGPVARAMGFKGVILHGLATLARAVASLERHECGGVLEPPWKVSMKFVKPLVLPSSASVFVDEKGGLWVGSPDRDIVYGVGAWEK